MSLEERRDRCLSEVSYGVAEMLSLPPIASTAIVQHVFQEILQQFYETGTAYFPNFGWLEFVDGEAIFLECEAFSKTTSRMAEALRSKTFSFALIDQFFTATKDAIQPAKEE